MKFEAFQNQNFFFPEDVDYLKYIINHILCSNLFKYIFIYYSNISDVSDYYFDDKKNMEDYINRIIFCPLM